MGAAKQGLKGPSEAQLRDWAKKWLAPLRKSPDDDEYDPKP
jgi:hypothetical protein